MDVPCPVHAGRRAHRGCHFCRRPICRLCELRMRGHLYCSPRCSRDDDRHAVWRTIRRRLDVPIRPALALAAVALTAAAPTLTALRAVSRLERLDEAPLRTSRDGRRPDSAPVIEIVMDTAAGARITGRARDGSAAFLFSPAGLVAATSVSEGRFQFEGVRAPGPYRVGSIPLSAEAFAPDLLRDAPQAPAGGAPTSLAAPDLTRGPSELRAIAVTFDAGSSDRGAAEILELLAGRGIRTTMFLTGEFIRRYPELTRRIAADGHEVGNHTNSHPRLTTYALDGRQATRAGVDRTLVARELRETAARYRETTGRELAPIWRAPYGEHNGEIRRWAAEAGYWHVGWTAGRAGLDGMDWISDPASPDYRDAEEVVERLVRRAENGGIVLLHLGSERNDPVGHKLASLFDGLAARGFRLVPVSEFLLRTGYTPERLAAFASRVPSPLR